MTEFQELIKNFDRIRDYMRQFYVYGFKVRNDFDSKSARTYDNERRRIESWLGDYTRSDYTAKGKHVYINVDSKTIPQNPLYAAWKSKSFTNNDLMLHFFILDLLIDCEGGMSAGMVGDAISETYGVAFDNQTVRLKLKEYENLGILTSKKEGKTMLYSLHPPLSIEQEPARTLWHKLVTAVTFYQETAPFGFIGSTILDRENQNNDWFQFKHHFIVHTLEDEVLADILKAMKEHRQIRFENKSSRTGKTTSMSGVPLKIFISTRTGRRYLCLYTTYKRRFLNVRLDSMAHVTQTEFCEDFAHKQELLKKNMPNCWGVSFGGPGRMEEICVKLLIDEKNETHILNRLEREGHDGELLRIRENEYLYSGSFFDTNEMLSWVKTFTGRILDIQGSNQTAVHKIVRDWDVMYQMYCAEDTRQDKNQ